MGLDHLVHALGGADDGIRRAGVQAKGATNAPVFVNHGDRARTFLTAVWVQGECRAPCQLGQTGNPFGAARRALVDVRRSGGHSLRVAAAVRITAPGALGLRQRVIYPRGQV